MKPILFNTDMVRAILDGRKTVTRRVMKPKPLWEKPPVQQKGYPEYWANWDDERIYKAPYRPSDILYVRETWAKMDCNECSSEPDDCESAVERDGLTIFCNGDMYAYKATDLLPNGYKWRPSIHMPREAARIFLRVTDVRVERLQHLGIEEALKEGITPTNRPGGCRCRFAFDGCMEEPCSNRTAYEIERHVEPFAQLWDSTIKPADRDLYGWAANPWVWIISFERISREEAGL